MSIVFFFFFFDKNQIIKFNEGSEFIFPTVVNRGRGFPQDRRQMSSDEWKIGLVSLLSSCQRQTGPHSVLSPLVSGPSDRITRLEVGRVPQPSSSSSSSSFPNISPILNSAEFIADLIENPQIIFSGRFMNRFP